MAINPFAGYLISAEQKDRGFLNKEELQLLINAKMKNAQYELVRDLFVFSCFCGLSYSDVKILTKDNIQISFDGHLWIITRRQKTNTDSSIRLLEVPKRIIEKYKGYARDNRVFPVPSNATCNKILKKIAEQCAIKTRLSYHVSRHTFGTLLTISQGVPIETVSRMMGHTNIKTTQIYAKITKEKICKRYSLKKGEITKLAFQYLDKASINPTDAPESVKSELAKINKRLDDIIRFIRNYEEDKLNPMIRIATRFEKVVKELCELVASEINTSKELQENALKKISETFGQHAGVINNQSKQINFLTQTVQKGNKKLLQLISLYSELANCGVMDGKRKENRKAEINNLIDEP